MVKELYLIYLKFFSVLFPLIHNVFISYVIILVLVSTCIYFNFKFIKKIKIKSISEILLKILLILIEVFLISFLVWFLIEHFHTYKMWNSSLKFLG